MKLSIIIPCYDESKTIRDVIEAVKNSPYPNKEVIIIDYCSTDGTQEILKTYTPPDDLVSKIIYHPVSRGKGASLRSGII